MHVVIFEVMPKPEGRDRYLSIAAELRKHLDEFDGFLSIERFQSLTDENKILSISFWRDEDSIAAWRNVMEHQQAQATGRTEIFDGYRIRIAEVIRDYTMEDRAQAPQPPPEDRIP